MGKSLQHVAHRPLAKVDRAGIARQVVVGHRRQERAGPAVHVVPRRQHRRQVLASLVAHTLKPSAALQERRQQPQPTPGLVIRQDPPVRVQLLSEHQMPHMLDRRPPTLGRPLAQHRMIRVAQGRAKRRTNLLQLRHHLRVQVGLGKGDTRGIHEIHGHH